MTLNRSAGPLLAVPLLAVALLVGACEAADPEVEPVPDTLSEGAQTDDTAAAGEELAPSPGALVPINRSAVRGRASITGDGDDFQVVVLGEGLEPGERYSATVHEGTCAEGGPIRLPLGRMTATAAGAGSLRMRVDADRIPTDSELFVQIQGPDDQPVACANIVPEE